MLIKEKMNCKYLILVGDGMADLPIPSLGGKTPLEYASTPAMDFLVKSGYLGQVKTIPEAMPPGSDIANMSLMGYDPAKYHFGRAPIEAASMGVKLGENETAFRCNLVTITDGIMVDYSAGHIETADAQEYIKLLQQKLGCDTFRFYPGVSYRHLFVIKDLPEGQLNCTPPHDISGKSIDSYLPQGPGADILNELSKKAHEILASSELNQRRLAEGKKIVTDIWLWGQGKSRPLPPMSEKFGLKGIVVSAVDLVRGLGVMVGLSAPVIKGATGYLGTNYAGKVNAVLQALKTDNFAFLHVEAPDETSHEGSVEKKLQAIEEFDKHVVAEVIKHIEELAPCRILVAPDHATPVSLKTHTNHPVPFVVFGHGITHNGKERFCESEAKGQKIISGETLFETFIKGSFDF